MALRLFISFTLVVVMSCFSIINSQLSRIIPSKYINPDFSFTSLEFTGGFEQSYDKYYDREGEFKLRLSPQARLFHQVNRKNLQRTYSWQPIAFLRFGEEVAVPNRIKHSGSTNFNWQDIYHKKNYNIELAPSIFSRFFTTHDDRVFFSMRSSVFVGIGKGRVENVSDISIAYFIFKSLEENGVLKRPINQSDYETLATAITKTRNQRILDTRRMRINEISKIDSLFRKMNWVSDFGPKYFTPLYDIRFNGIANPRLNGMRWVAGIEPQFFYRSEKNEYSSREFDLTPQLSLEFHKPLSIRWQRDITLRARYNRSWFNIDLTDFRTHYSRFFAVDQSIGIGYYPNTRTACYARLRNTAFFLTSDTNDFNSFDSSLSLTAEYFINWNLKLTFSSQMRHDWFKDSRREAENDFNQLASLKISYILL